MSRSTIAVSKFVGSVSLGLLTGTSYSLAMITLPSLLILPSSTTAYQTFNRLSSISNTNVRVLSAISTSSLLLAYSISPRRGRHPYLLWTALTVVMSLGADVLLTTQPRRIESRRKSDLDAREINGEEVRKSMEGFRKSMLVKTSILGVGFLMSIVGIWGDGF